MYLRHPVRSPNHLRHEDAKDRSGTCCRIAVILQSTKLPQIAGTDCVVFRPTYVRHIGIPARRCWIRTASRMGTDNWMGQARLDSVPPTLKHARDQGGAMRQVGWERTSGQ